MSDPQTITQLAPPDLFRLPKLAAALAKVQSQLPELERDREVVVVKKNGDTYSYKYATLANVSKAALPLLAKHGLAFAAMPGAGADGRMSLRYALLHDSGETLHGEFPISGEGGIQMIGGRITYARRYVLTALTGITADEDDESSLDDSARPTAQRRPTQQPRADAQKARETAQRRRHAPAPALPGENAPQSTPDMITDAQQRRLHQLLRERELSDRDAGLAYISEKLRRDVTSTRELTKADAGEVIDRLVQWADSEEPQDVGGANAPGRRPHPGPDPAEATP